MTKTSRSNVHIAGQLERVAELLEILGKNPFRVRSYRRAASVVRQTAQPMAALLDQDGREGLMALPGIGVSMARGIEQIVQGGRLGLLDRLEAEASPEALLTRVPGIGPERARRIHAELGIKTLEQLEAAAHDGRLASVAGIGPTLVRGTKDVLAGLLGGPRAGRSRDRDAGGSRRDDRPGVDLLLEVDEAYRAKAAAGELRSIAPRRFNPSGEAWLPVMKMSRRGWSFRALFSNTKQAHDLDRTQDWVVIYYRQGSREGQATVVTARSGALAGLRVVRGRERESLRHHRE